MREHMEDFSPGWCQHILTSPEYHQYPLVNRKAPPPFDIGSTDVLLSRTFYTDDTIRALRHVSYPGTPSPDNPPQELLLLVSLADGLDGWKNHMHGGMISLFLDNTMVLLGSHVAMWNARKEKGMDAAPPMAVTKELKVKFKRPVMTPGLVLVRATMVNGKGAALGRILNLRCTVEDGMGKVFAEGEAVIQVLPVGGRKPRSKDKVSARL